MECVRSGSNISRRAIPCRPNDKSKPRNGHHVDRNMNQPGTSDPRAEPRTNLFLGAVIRGAGVSLPVKVRNMSASGALVEGTALPDEGTDVQLARGSLALPATVAWSAPGRCGLRFSSLACVQDWLAAPANPGQQRVDEAVRVLKLGAVPIAPRPAPQIGLDSGRQLAQFGDDLRGAIRLVRDLCHELSTDDEAVRRHAEKLQNMDIVQQTVAAVADALAGEMDESAAATRLGSLRASCAAALGQAPALTDGPRP